MADGRHGAVLFRDDAKRRQPRQHAVQRSDFQTDTANGRLLHRGRQAVCVLRPLEEREQDLEVDGWHREQLTWVWGHTELGNWGIKECLQGDCLSPTDISDESGAREVGSRLLYCVSPLVLVATFLAGALFLDVVLLSRKRWTRQLRLVELGLGLLAMASLVVMLVTAGAPRVAEAWFAARGWPIDSPDLLTAGATMRRIVLAGIWALLAWQVLQTVRRLARLFDAARV